MANINFEIFVPQNKAVFKIISFYIFLSIVSLSLSFLSTEFSLMQIQTPLQLLDLNVMVLLSVYANQEDKIKETKPTTTKN